MKYLDFNDYAANDPEYLMRVLTNRLHEPQEEIHFLDGSSYVVEFHSNSRMWLLNNQMHREDGPAVEHDDGIKMWYLRGRLNREDGPAVEYFGNHKEWWLNGVLFTNEEFNKKINELSKNKSFG